jgi:hypothetical protein
MMLENAWESDEAEDWESDESIAEADESAEDIGERARWRRRRSGPAYARGVPAYARGVRGMRTSSGPVAFPARLATAAETNRGLATQELARRRLEEQFYDLERRDRLQQKSDISVSGLVTLLIGGGLTFWGVAQARQAGFTFNSWANQQATQMAALVSATHLATSGAKLAVRGQYLSSPLGIAGDAFAIAQLAAFAFGAMPTTGLGRPQPIVVGNKRDLEERLPTLKPNDVVVTKEEHETWEIIADTVNNANTYRHVAPE